MRLVFDLREELRRNPGRVERTEKLTLDQSKPLSGLLGRYGLLGSQEWWESIASGKMPLLLLSGVAERVYVAGQDQDDINTADIRLADGTLRAVGIYVMDKRDLALFGVGHKVSVVYALDELKQQPAPDGGVNVSLIAVEMAVSLRPLQAQFR